MIKEIKGISRVILIRKINKALEIRLTKAQKEYIFRGYDRFIYGERKQGKTIAHIIRLNVSEIPIDKLRLEKGHYNDMLIDSTYTRFFVREFKKIRQKLIDSGIQVACIRQ